MGSETRHEAHSALTTKLRGPTKRCNSEYSESLIGRCKRGTHVNGIMYCLCEGDCALCTVGKGKGVKPMNSAIYEARMEEIRVADSAELLEGITKRKLAREIAFVKWTIIKIIYIMRVMVNTGTYNGEARANEWISERFPICFNREVLNTVLFANRAR